MEWKVPLSDLNYDGEEKGAVLRVLQSKWISMGKETELFEQEFADYLGVNHTLAVSNGTAALHLALLALEIGPGDAVIQPAVNFVSAANMTIATGATPVFVDIISRDEPTISSESLKNTLQNWNLHSPTLRPKAVVVMHYGGYSCRMDEIQAICKEYDLKIIEDACHGIGASHDGAMLGSLADLGCFSFFSNKNLATGEGGMVTTNHEGLAAKIKQLRSHGMTSLTWERHKGHAATYDVVLNGYNYRIDDIHSALGRVQLNKLESGNRNRRRLTRLYWEKLAPLVELGWQLPFRESAGVKNLQLASCHLLPVVAPTPEVRWRCADELKAAAIQTSLHYPFIPAFTAFSSSGDHGRLSVAKEFCSRIMTLPLYSTMTEDDVDYVASSLIKAARLLNS